MHGFITLSDATSYDKYTRKHLQIPQSKSRKTIFSYVKHIGYYQIIGAMLTYYFIIISVEVLLPSQQCCSHVKTNPVQKRWERKQRNAASFPQTIRDCNAHPASLISSAEGPEDCVAKFTSQVRARD